MNSCIDNTEKFLLKLIIVIMKKKVKLDNFYIEIERKIIEW